MGDSKSEQKNTIVRTIKNLWAALWRPSARYSMGILLIAGIFIGIGFWGSYHWAMELSNEEAFCISCHEMKNTVYEELKETVHYSNTSGVRAICSDCHVPHEWQHKIVRKVQATKDVFFKITGKINTPEKFEAHRLDMAKRVWKEMVDSDSRECRNCHQMDSMKLEDQVRPARRKHEKAVEEGKTCIECHQGIAHELPEGWDDEEF